MQKIVIKKPWGVEIKDYKAGDPIPAGVKFKIFDAKDTAKIDAYADSFDESADYQKKRFKEPAYMYNESAKPIKEAQERKKDYLAIVKRFRSDINKHIDKVERDIERGFVIDYSDRDEAQVLGTRFSAELLRYNLAVENKTLTESFIITDSINGKPIYFHYGKFTGYDWGFDKNMATKFSTKEAADKMIERMRQEGAIVKDMKVISEGRIAKGYENLDADERAKHLLSHPSSKYMSDLKSENITERAIRKAVKEMLGKPAKDDPQFITDVNEEGCIKESAFYVKFSQDGKSSKYYTYANGKHGWTDNKSGATKFSTRDEAEASLKKNPYYDAFNMKYFDVVQEEGEAPAVATTTANVENPELPLKLKESLSSKTHKFKPEELKVGKRVIDKVGGKEVHGKITVNHHDIYKDNPYRQDGKGSTVVTITTDSGRSYDVDANDNGGEFILEGCKGKKKVVESYKVIFPTGASQKFSSLNDVNKFLKANDLADVQLTDSMLDKWNKENDIPLVIVKEDIEDSYKYQTSVAGGMGTDAENAESAKEHDDEVVLVREHKSFRKYIKESLEDDKAKALEDYKQAKAKYLADKSDENWKNFIEKKNVCMSLGVRI